MKTGFYKHKYFCLFLKCPSLAFTPKCSIYLGIFYIMLSLCVYYYLYGYTQKPWHE